MAGKRLQKRKKKKGKALFISRLLRLAMLSVLLAGVGLAAVGVKICADYVRDKGVGSSAENPQQQAGEAQVFEPLEGPSVFAGLSVSGVVTIDPGHGGIDPGCGEEGALEKDIVLSICVKLRDMLEQAGVAVVMTRQTDETVSLDDRAVAANNAGSDLFVSVHCNSFEGQARGLECYYHKAEAAKQLAQSIVDGASELGITTRSVQKNNYQVLWDTDMTAVLVETGFLTDPEECALLCRPDYQQTVARAIARAVLSALPAALA